MHRHRALRWRLRSTVGGRQSLHGRRRGSWCRESHRLRVRVSMLDHANVMPMSMDWSHRKREAISTSSFPVDPATPAEFRESDFFALFFEVADAAVAVRTLALPAHKPPEMAPCGRAQTFRDSQHHARRSWNLCWELMDVDPHRAGRHPGRERMLGTLLPRARHPGCLIDLKQCFRRPLPQHRRSLAARLSHQMLTISQGAVQGEKEEPVQTAAALQT